MFIRTHVQLVAWSSDGESGLLEIKMESPEGGGSLDYHVISPDSSIDQTFHFSGDFSPGDGSQPQRISSDQCQKELNRLRQTLEKTHFTGIDLQPEACRSQHRKDFLILSPVLREAVQKSRFLHTREGDKLVNDAWGLHVQQDKILLIQKGKMLHSWAFDHTLEPLQQEAALSPTHHLLFLFENSEYETRLLRAYYSPDAKPESLTPILTHLPTPP